MDGGFSLITAIRAIFDPGNTLTAHERLVAACLSRHADLYGECFPSQSTIARECGITDRTVRKTLASLRNKQWLVWAKEPGRVAKYHITPERDSVTPEPHSGVQGEPRNEIPDTPERRSDEVSQLSIKNTTPPKSPPVPNGQGGYTPEFEEFWLSYPRKREKRKAFRVWKARLNDRDCPGTPRLVGAAKAYADECRRDGRSEKHIKYAATFLGPDKPFEDYLMRADEAGKLVGPVGETERPLSWIPEEPFEG